MNPNLEMQVTKTNAGLWTVTYGRKEAPLDVQEAAFAANGIEIVSPAQLGFLRHKGGKCIFEPYSRTSADVLNDVYDGRDNRVVIVPNRELSNIFGIHNLVTAHRQNKEYVLPEDQRDLIYAMVDEMIKKGIAITAKFGQTDIPISDFGQTGLTSNLFSDERLGIKAQDYGDWLKEQGRSAQSMFFDNERYAKSQKGPYLSRLRVYGPDGDFIVGGGSRDLGDNDGAFGVRFEKTAEGGPKK